MGIRFNARSGTIYLDEQTAADTNVAGRGQLWVKDDTPASLVFTDDAGTDVTIASGGALAAPSSPSATVVGKWTYDDSSTTISNPGSGNIRFNNATPTSASRISIHYIDADSTDWEQHILDAWGGSVFGTLIRMTKVGDPTTYIVWALNSDSDQLDYNVPWINIVGWEGTWTGGDEIYIEIQTQPYVQRPTTDHGLYIGSANLSGQPIGGLVQTTLLRHDPDIGSATLEFWDGGANNFEISQNGAITDIGKSTISVRHRGTSTAFYGSTNILPRLSISESAITIGHQNDAANGAPYLAMHERDSAPSTTNDFGYVWVKRESPNSLIFTDDTGTDYDLTNIGTTSTTISSGWSTGSGGSFTIAANAPLLLAEQGTNDTPAAGFGQVWVKNDTPNTLYFTDDAGTDWLLNSAGGSGDVTKVGTPVDNQIGVWTGDGTIEGVTSLTYDGTSLVAYDSVLTASTINGQDETFYDNSPTTEGTFSGGTGFAPSPGVDDGDTVTLSDGTIITIDNVAAGGNIDQFTVTTSTTTPFLFGNTLTQSSTTGSGTGFSLTPDYDNVTRTITTHHLGIDANNRLSFESGSNYGRIQVSDPSVGATACNLWFDLNSSSTGSHAFYFSDGGFGGPKIIFDLTNDNYRFDGGLELIERADHSLANISGGRGQIWVKSSGGGGELMYTEGDWDVDYTVQNMMIASYRFDTDTGATDPGAGDLKFDNATAGSVTNIYINDAESTTRDNDYMLGNLADGDIINLRSPGVSASAPRWWIGRVNGTPTDNTGWWTIPVTHIANSGSVFNSGYPVHVEAEWSSKPAQSTGKYFARKSSDEDVTSSTTLQDDDDLGFSSVAAGTYRMTMWIEIRDLSGTSNSIKWAFTTTSTSDANYFYSANISSTNSDLARIGVDLYNEEITQTCPSGAGTGYVEFTGYFTITGTGSIQFRWAQGTSNGSAIRVGTGSWMALERVGT